MTKVNVKNYIDFLKNPDYLHIRLIASWAEDTVEECISQIREVLRANDNGLVLIDTRYQSFETSVFSDYFTAESLEITELGKYRKIAFLVDSAYEDRTRPFILKIKGEDINCRMFYDINEAIQWLTEK